MSVCNAKLCNNMGVNHAICTFDTFETEIVLCELHSNDFEHTDVFTQKLIPINLTPD